ncbi:hypothetical protein [Streptomyces sp. SPB4]|uniref:hypothetical protein n=1 Tax=Streptomyces sp. SPB4 TaxID=2940553 RepID=UPI002476F239|nr:hypothetical protein [Streptomyces sp. SPB4]MDH6538034.1 hypothetical protein [Streptomyces sp. SPB4]
MTEQAVHPADETFALHATARAFEELRNIVKVPSSRQEIPDLFVAADQLQHLSALIADVSDEVLFRVATDTAEPDQGPVILAYTSALVPAGRAMEGLTASAEQLGFLRRFAHVLPGAPELEEGREAAFLVVQDRLKTVRAELGDAAHGLHCAADRLGGAPPRSVAALSRSARITDATALTAPEPRAKAPARLAYTPAPRHGR